MSMVTRLIAWQRFPVVGRAAKEILALYGLEVPRAVEIGHDLVLPHHGYGAGFHPLTTIGNHVTVFQGANVCRGDAWGERPAMGRVYLGDDVVLGAGAKVVCNSGTLTVGRGTVVGANAVLTTSTGDGEVWAGIPARLIGKREDYDPIIGSKRRRECPLCG